jgi:hypothetical protein
VIEPPAGNKSAATWQIVVTTVGLIAIVAVFLFGINHQRDETAGEQTAATASAPASPQGGEPQQDQQQAGQSPSTTGQGGGHQKEDQPQNNGEAAQRQSQ